MKKFVFVVSSLALSVPFAAQAQSDTIASTAQAAVTQAEITTMLKGLSPEQRVQFAANPAGLDQVVRSRLAVDTVLAEATAKGWDKQPQVQALIDAERRQVIVKSYLDSVTAPPADYPSDADIQTVYTQNQAAFTVPHALRLSQIYLAKPANADAATLARLHQQANDLDRQARASGADFAALARANSQDQASAAKGGDMDFVPDSIMLPEIRSVATALKAGDVSNVIETPTGFHIIKLTGTRDAHVLSLAETREQIRAKLRQQRAQMNQQAYLAQRVGPSAVTINEAALGKAVSAAQ